MESSIVEKIQRAFTARGIFLVKIHGSAMQQSGIPDLVGCYNGRFIGIEVKQPGHARKDLCLRGECASPIQQYTIQEIREAGGVAFVAHSLAEAESAITAAVTEESPCALEHHS